MAYTKREDDGVVLREGNCREPPPRDDISLSYAPPRPPRVMGPYDKVRYFESGAGAIYIVYEIGVFTTIGWNRHEQQAELLGRVLQVAREGLVRHVVVEGRVARAVRELGVLGPRGEDAPHGLVVVRAGETENAGRRARFRCSGATL